MIKTRITKTNIMTTLEFVKNEIIKEKTAWTNSKGLDIKEFNFDCEFIYITYNKGILSFDFDGGYYIFVTKKSKEVKRSVGADFTCAYKTPKGYISSKKLPVEIKDTNDVTLEEAYELLKFTTDAIQNTFDPFWHENQAKARNEAAWVSIATNHLQPDCR